MWNIVFLSFLKLIHLWVYYVSEKVWPWWHYNEADTMYLGFKRQKKNLWHLSNPHIFFSVLLVSLYSCCSWLGACLWLSLASVFPLQFFVVELYKIKFSKLQYNNQNVKCPYFTAHINSNTDILIFNIFSREIVIWYTTDEISVTILLVTCRSVQSAQQGVSMTWR